MQKRSPHSPERDTHLLPNFDSTQIDAIFADIASPNIEMQQNMYAYNIYRRLLRMGYVATLEKENENFSLINIAADDDYFIEITAITSKNGTPKPLMAHQELTGSVRKISEELYGNSGMYRFQATFTLKYYTYDEERAEELGIEREDTRDETTVGSITKSAYDFHQLIQGALYQIQRDLDAEVYPAIRRSSRKVF